MPGMLPGLIPQLAIGEKIVTGQLAVAQVGDQGLLNRRQLTPPSIRILWRQIPKIGGEKHHIDCGAMGHGQLPGPTDVIQQLPVGGGQNVGASEILERRHGDANENANDGNYHQQLNERKTE